MDSKQIKILIGHASGDQSTTLNTVTVACTATTVTTLKTALDALVTAYTPSTLDLVSPATLPATTVPHDVLLTGTLITTYTDATTACGTDLTFTVKETGVAGAVTWITFDTSKNLVVDKSKTNSESSMVTEIVIGHSSGDQTTNSVTVTVSCT